MKNMTYKNLKPHKQKLTIYIDRECILWLQEMQKRKVFASFSHGVEYCLNLVKNIVEKKSMEIVDEMRKSIPDIKL